MFFIPYRVDLQLFRFPIITVFICLLCIGVYNVQTSNESKLLDLAYEHCVNDQTRMWKMILQKTMGEMDAEACFNMLGSIHVAAQPARKIAQLASEGESLQGFSKRDSDTYKTQLINERYAQFSRIVPAYKTQALWYEPQSWNVVNMLTATFAHADWFHLIGNLFFFFAFAAAVEVVLGYTLFPVVIVALAIGTHVFYSIAMLGVTEPPPSLGLSGVVMGMMALLAFLLPSAQIRCFLWFIIIFKRFSVPALLLTMWFVGWDVYTLFWGDQQSGVNIIAHVSGAALGYLFGLMFFRSKRDGVLRMAYVSG